MSAERGRLFIRIFALIWVLSACSDTERPIVPSTATPFVYTPVEQIVVAPIAGPVQTAGYLYADAGGIRLVDGISFSVAGMPSPLSGVAAQIWIGRDGVIATDRWNGVMGIRYVAVVVRGTLEGPGRYGPGGQYRLQLNGVQFDILTPQDRTLSELFAAKRALGGTQFVRVTAAILARGGTALLVERIGPGGLPDAGSREIKLSGVLRDRALLERLKGVRGGILRYGIVQVEGFWRDGVLVPLSIRFVE